MKEELLVIAKAAPEVSSKYESLICRKYEIRF